MEMVAFLSITHQSNIQRHTRNSLGRLDTVLRQKHKPSTIPPTLLKLFQMYTGVIENNMLASNVIAILWAVRSDIYSCIMSGNAKASFHPQLPCTENQSRSYTRGSTKQTRRSGSRDMPGPVAVIQLARSSWTEAKIDTTNLNINVSAPALLHNKSRQFQGILLLFPSSMKWGTDFVSGNESSLFTRSQLYPWISSSP